MDLQVQKQKQEFKAPEMKEQEQVRQVELSQTTMKTKTSAPLATPDSDAGQEAASTYKETKRGRTVSNIGRFKSKRR